MTIRFGKLKDKYGAGVEIDLTGDEVATAIRAYLVAHHIEVNGPNTVTVNGKLCEEGQVYVFPPGFVNADGRTYLGSHGKEE